ncbi:MAG: hypothetical protein BHW25_08395 [Faecalibacterium sp. CAG:82-related_59_9]|nr:MAG: hypothetical protein BHW25_08395 [Faecalibacterium sp. CAG:82-related_59_9]
MQEIILTQEALFEERIGHLADTIVKSGGKKFIMIAGPSSSGKTTFSHRLSIQLAAKGLKPHPFPLDDYYVNRDQCPRDENGELDLECLEALDVETLTPIEALNFLYELKKTLKGSLNS